MSESDELRKRVAAWVSKASTDLAAIDALTAESRFSAIRAFHAQQAGEKYLKALLIAHRRPYPKTHDISLLMDLCDRAGIEGVQAIRGCRLLTAHAVESRYTEDNAPVSDEELAEAKHAAERVRDFVLAGLPFGLDE